MEQNDRDIVVFTDDEGNEREMEVLDYFFCEGKEYAILTDAVEGDDECECGCEECAHKCEECGDECECDDECECGEECECGAEDDEDDDEDAVDMYIMEVVQMEGDMEEFVPVEDEKLMDKLIAIAEMRFDEEIDAEDEEDDEDEEDPEKDQ